MTIEIDPDVARGVATRLSAEADEFQNLENSVRWLRAKAMLDDHGSDAEFELREAHPELSSLSDLIRLWADRLETTDADLARQLDEQIAAALGTFYTKVVRDGVSDPSLAVRNANETNEEYLVRITAATTELRLRQLGLLEGETVPYYDDWLLNAARNGVHSDEIVKIADEFDVTPSSFRILSMNWEVKDNDGKSFFVIINAPEWNHYVMPSDIRWAVLMTYIFNAGTGYGTAKGSENNDFAETPYSVEEVRRISERIERNAWTYDGTDIVPDVSEVWLSGGAVAATPNGMLFGVQGNNYPPYVLPPMRLMPRLVDKGGTTYGDLFILPHPSENPLEEIRQRIESGHLGVKSSLDSDRILHHEEKHGQQFAKYGLEGFIARYGLGQITPETATPESYLLHNPYEIEAGLSDGGYDP